MIPGIVASQLIDTGPNDPLWADVVSLLHFPGADGSTTFTDETGKVWTPLSSPAGNPQIDTSLGYNTGLFVPGSYLRTPSAADTNIIGGSFCLEQWVYLIAAPSGGDAYMICQDDGTNDGQNFQFAITPGRVVQFIGWASSARGSFWVLNSGANLVPTGALAHIAADRNVSEGKTRVFIDGIKYGEATNSHWAGNALQIALGSFIDGPNDEFAFARINGHVRASRITRASRYTANFTPPALPWPTS